MSTQCTIGYLIQKLNVFVFSKLQHSSSKNNANINNDNKQEQNVTSFFWSLDELLADPQEQLQQQQKILPALSVSDMCLILLSEIVVEKHSLLIASSPPSSPPPTTIIESHLSQILHCTFLKLDSSLAVVNQHTKAILYNLLHTNLSISNTSTAGKLHVSYLSYYKQ